MSALGELHAKERLEHYRSFQTYESHFNNLQVALRSLASVWLLAALGAFSFLLQSEGGNLAIQRELAVAVVSLLGTVGLAVLWTIDQLVYRRLLASVFIVALKMEFDFPEIPPMRTTMLLNSPSSKGGMSPLLRTFYLVPMTALISIGAVTMIIGADPGQSVYWLRVVAVLASVAVLLVALRGSFRLSENMDARAMDLGGEEFHRYVSHIGEEAPRRLQRRSDPGK